ncbi:MAG: DUF1330 domain-containing protein [Ignavibacteriales bacterium]|nr:DUF1330 domain-containing protein [Ignavibacteriales bacterium]MCB9207765.1 DUF1330 domain-containing protein [Ignavibacteriales bacterium]
MNYYFIANIKINDENEYKKYLEKVDDIFEKYNGKYLSVDNNPILLEGKWEYTRNVLIEFPTKQDFDNWYFSEEYQNILKHRLTAAECDTILISGLE